MYIKNKRDSSNIKDCSPFGLSCKLKVLCFEIAYFSYTHRCAALKDRTTQQELAKLTKNENFANICCIFAL